LKQNLLGDLPIEELIIALAAIPAHITSIDFGSNCLDKLGRHLDRFFAAAPPSIKVLKLSKNYLDGGRDITKIPGKVSAAVIRNIEEGPDLQKAIAATPAHIVEIDLTENNIGVLPTEVLVPMFRGIPKHVKKLNLQCNALHRKPPGKLARLLAAIPTSIDTLDLSYNNIAANLSTIFTSISKGVTCLILASINLASLSGEAIASAFSLIPFHVTTLNLGRNNLGSKPAAELAIALAALPPHVTTIYLCENGFDRFSRDDLDIIYDALPASVKFIGWDDPTAENGVTLFAWEKSTRPITPASSVATEVIETVVLLDSPSLSPLVSPYNFFPGASATPLPDETPVPPWLSLV
jgi:hypothetical protein